MKFGDGSTTIWPLQERDNNRSMTNTYKLTNFKLEKDLNQLKSERSNGQEEKKYLESFRFNNKNL